MSKNVIVYARYSTDRQDEQSIETQIERCQAVIDQHGWHLVDTFHDSAVSGTSYKRRPGIQQLLRRVERGGIDIVLCLSTDRLSRDVAHSAQIGKKLSYHDVELWTARANARISDIEMNIGAVLSQETVEQGRYRTREGMRTTVQKGKAAGNRPATRAKGGHRAIRRWQVCGADYPWPSCRHPGRPRSVARGFTGTAGSTIFGVRPQTFCWRVQVARRQNKIPAPLRSLAGRARAGMDGITSLSGCGGRI